MTGSISAARVATLAGAGSTAAPAYAGLADALALLIGDGRIGLGTRLPSERELTEALGVSRTTVTRAYAALRDARVRRGPARRRAPSPGVPGGRARAHDRALLARPGRRGRDRPQLRGRLRAARASRRPTPRRRPSCRPTSAATATSPPGLPQLQRAIAATYDARGLPTEPDQVMVTAGALSAASIVAQALTGARRPGAGRVAGLPQRDPGDPAERRPAGRLPGRPRRLGPRRRRRRAAADRAAAGLPDPRLPEPHRAPDDRRPARGVRRAPAPDRARSPSSTRRTRRSPWTGRRCRRRSPPTAPDAITIGSASKASGAACGWAGSAARPAAWTGSPARGSAWTSGRR